MDEVSPESRVEGSVGSCLSEDEVDPSPRVTDRVRSNRCQHLSRTCAVSSEARGIGQRAQFVQ
jgi:hypothetical protein